MSKPSLRFAYFGGEPLGVPVLEELKRAGLMPALVVCNLDRPVGRKHVLTPPPVKVWATENNVPVFQPESYKDRAALAPLCEGKFDLFVVVAYNFILPQRLIELPPHKTINVHPSLLPKFRGASPIRSAILADECTTGVTIMLMDEKMDHGPILAQEMVKIHKTDWPMSGPALDELLAKKGGELLAWAIPMWVDGAIVPQPQVHEAATYCGKLTKAMAEIQLDPHHLPSGQTAYETYLKIQAFAGAPGAFFIHEGKRFKINAAHLSTSGTLVIDSITPEGKNETNFKSYFG